MRASGKKTEFVDGMRVTDEHTLKLVEEELQYLNGLIVGELCEMGAKAIGLSGKDENLIQAQKKKSKVDLGFVGQITGINTQVINEELKSEKIPVILPMARSAEKNLYNVNADDAASIIAGSLMAEKLVLLTNVKGVMRNAEDPSSFISTLTVNEAQALMRDRIISEGMIPKVNACILALGQGVKKTHMIDARIPHGLLLEIFTDQGVGTEIIIE
jgi:acetylglutamate kinase